MQTKQYKQSRQLKERANLRDYARAYRTFDAKKAAASELTWFDDGTLNAAYNAVDRHLDSGVKNKIALYWVGADEQTEQYTFADIARLSNQFGNYLKSLGVARRERVFFFLPRLPVLYYGFLGVLKIGAIAGTLFSAFQEDALFDRLENSGAKVVITTAEMKGRVDKIAKKLSKLQHIVVVDSDTYTKKLHHQSEQLHIAHMRPNEYGFMLYTSGTTGKPKGVVHRHLAILHQHLTSKWVLDLKDDDVFWCTADPGWITGIAYEILGNWSNRVTTVVYAGRFNPEKWYEIVQTYRVTVWYTAPTAVRMLMAAGKKLVARYDFSSLRHILSVGEPLNPEAIQWGIAVFGLAFHDTWFQTETAGIMIANVPGVDIKLGSMGKPVPGVHADVVDEQGKPVPAGTEGSLVIRPGWIGMMQTVWRRPGKYESYFEYDWYITGDRAYRDTNGYFWFVGRDDDVIKTAGERVGPFEVESALVEHAAVVEAGVIGKPDKVRGQIIKAFIVLAEDYHESDKLKEEIAQHVKKHLAGHAYPREIEVRDRLPKTRSGKIVRRILKAQELGQPVGDTSTLEEY